MRFEFNQRTRLSTGSRNFGILDARIFRRQIFFIDRQPYVRVISREPAMRVRSRCRLQLLELGAGSCAIWPGRGQRAESPPPGTKVHLSGGDPCERAAHVAFTSAQYCGMFIRGIFRDFRNLRPRRFVRRARHIETSERRYSHVACLSFVTDL